MDECRALHLRRVLDQPPAQLFQPRNLANLIALQLRGPARHLALQELYGFAKAFQADGLPIGIGQLSQSVNQLKGQLPVCLGIRRDVGRQRILAGETRMPFQQRERHANHFAVLTSGHQPGMGNARGADGLEQLHLTQDVVGAGVIGHCRWEPKCIGHTVVVNPVDQVAGTALDGGNVKGTLRAQLTAEPGLQTRKVR
ncbi:hypothetical protein D9M71_509790 [compost metagenome]